MRSPGAALANIGTRRSPIDLGDGRFAYKRNGRWKYRDPQKQGRFLHKFVEVTDRDLILELETRGYQIVHPAHECVDRPNLPCPACELQARKRHA
jgi:hypothetical protein